MRAIEAVYLSHGHGSDETNSSTSHLGGEPEESSTVKIRQPRAEELKGLAATALDALVLSPDIFDAERGVNLELSSASTQQELDEIEVALVNVYVAGELGSDEGFEVRAGALWLLTAGTETLAI